MKYNIIISFICVVTTCCFSLKCASQQIRLKEEHEINLTNDTITNIIFDESSGNYFLYFFSSETTKSKICPDKDSLFYVTQLIDNENRKIKLASLEYCVKLSLDTLTTLENPLSGGSVIRQYQINGGNLLLLNLKKDSVLLSLTALKCGNFLYSDNYDGSITKTILIDRKFQKISNISSIYSYYENCNIDDSGQELVIMNKNESSDSANALEILKVNASTGSIINKFNFHDCGLHFQNVHVVNNYILLSYLQPSMNSCGLRLLNSDGSTFWEKEQSGMNNFWFLDQEHNNLIFASNGKIVSRNALNGEIAWQADKKQILQFLKKSNSFFIGRYQFIDEQHITNFIQSCQKIDSNNYLLNIGFFDKSINSYNRLIKYVIVLISDTGVLRNACSFESPTGLCKLLMMRGDLWVLTNKKLIKYEINNN